MNAKSPATIRKPNARTNSSIYKALANMKKLYPDDDNNGFGVKVHSGTRPFHNAEATWQKLKVLTKLVGFATIQPKMAGPKSIIRSNAKVTVNSSPSFEEDFMLFFSSS